MSRLRALAATLAAALLTSLVAAAPATAAYAAPTVSSSDWPQGIKVTVIPVDPQEYSQITSWSVVAEPGHHVATIKGTNVDSTVLKGLTPGTTYAVSVTANGPAGQSAPTRFTTTPLLTTSVFGVGDLGSDGRNDIIGRQSQARGGDVLGYRGNGAGGFMGSAFNTGDIVHGRLAFHAGDLNGDGHPDLAYENNGALQWRRSTGRDHFLTEDLSMGGGWGGMRFITGGGDFSGDGKADVVAVANTGEMYLYRGSGTGRLVSKTKINAGWGSMAGVFSPGDFNGDRARDLLAVDRAGVMWLYPGNGRGGLKGTRSKVGSGWLTLGWAGPLEDFTGDGRADIGGVTTDGKLYVYAGNGRGGIRSKTSAGSGWQRFF
jgi:hypothetical protein